MTNQAEDQRYLKLLEERLALLGTLSESLLTARAALVSLDVSRLEKQVEEQRMICRSIQAASEELERLQFRCAAHVRLRDALPASGADVRVREVLERMHQAQMSVKQLNDEHQALLRRTRRTANALLQALQGAEPTYQRPSIGATLSHYRQAEAV